MLSKTSPYKLVSDPNVLLKTSSLINTDTTIVGFASSTSNDNELIRSIQPIYYSSTKSVCDSLAVSPTLGPNTKIAAEPLDISTFLDRFMFDSEF